MCAVSMVTGHFFERYPQVTQFPPNYYNDYAELVRKARLYDEMTNQKACPDPKKEAWHKGLEEYMRDRYGMEPRK